LKDDQQKSFHLQHLSSPEPKIRRKKTATDEQHQMTNTNVNPRKS
jgi:hypothetical protein